MSHQDCHCDTPHYEEDEHANSCMCEDCHTFRHFEFDHVGLCSYCDDEEQAELDLIEAGVFDGTDNGEFL